MSYPWIQLLFAYLLAIITCLGLNNRAYCLSGESFTPATDCVCPGHIVTYQCIVQGELLTVWQGSAFQCASREVTLTNIEFGTSAAFGECNTDEITIVGRGLSIDNGCYTSELNVTFVPALQGTTVTCSVDNGTHSREVDHAVLQASTQLQSDPLLSSQNITLSGVNSTALLFSWEQTLNCPSLYYNIMSDNCGNCPNTTTDTSVSCFHFTTAAVETVCTFTVQTVICGDGPSPIQGNLGNPVAVNLTVPIIHQVSSTPHYHLDNGLRGITVNFSTVVPFIIYGGINGSIESYVVTYSDVASGRVCDLKTIPANSSGCSSGVCSDEFNVLSSLCPQSSNITATVFVVTNIGNGVESNTITEEYQNNYVSVKVVTETSSIECMFPEVMSAEVVDNSCNATIIHGQSCQDRTPLFGEVISDSLISIRLDSFLEETRSSQYCGFVADVRANGMAVTVEGDLAVFMILDDGNASGTIAAAVIAVVAVVAAILAPIIIILIIRTRNKAYISGRITQSGTNLKLPKMYTVDQECNMIEFAKKLNSSYDPDSGIGYFQLQPDMPEYISSTTKVVLLDEDETKMCTGPKARALLGFCDKRQPIKMPESPWKYAFIQSTSRLRKLPKDTHIIFYPDVDEYVKLKQSCTDKEVEKVVNEQYYQLYYVPQDCTTTVKEFLEDRQLHYSLCLGYAFYEFTEPELIAHNKQVILMDKDGKLYHGLHTRREIGLDLDYDEAMERQQPNFPEDSRWKKAFVQTRSNVRKLKPNTTFLFCTVASTELVEVHEPFEIFNVTEEDEDARKLIKFARKKIPHYTPSAGYAYYEFTKRGYVLPERNVLALRKTDEKLYTGPGVRTLIGAAADYDGITEIDPPDLADTDWDCIFIQAKEYGRILVPNTRFLYCEYD